MNSDSAEADDQAVVPVRVSLFNTWEFLSMVFKDMGIDNSLLIMELLRSIFGTEGVYGKQTGAYGIYLNTKPENCTLSDEQADVYLHEALQILCDELTAIIPNIQADGIDTQYHYPNGPQVIFYLPVDPEKLDRQSRSKVIPKKAVRHLVR